jgi:hypothetical protein
MTDDIGHDSGYPERASALVRPEYEGDYGSPGEASNGMNATLDLILHEMKNPTIRPKAQVLLTFAGGVGVSDIIATHVRYYIENITVLQSPTVPIDIKTGSASIIAGIGLTAIGALPCSFIIDSGTDIQAVSQTGASPYAGRTQLLLTGWIID